MSHAATITGPSPYVSAVYSPPRLPHSRIASATTSSSGIHSVASGAFAISSGCSPVAVLSALIKRYVAEPGSDWLEGLVFEPDQVLILTSRVTMVEVWSALARRQRESSISDAHHADALDAFREDCLWRYRFVEFEGPVYNLAGELIGRHPLRAYDSVQLASALVASRILTKADLPQPTFLCADARLLDAAQGEGLVGINPTLRS